MAYNHDMAMPQELERLTVVLNEPKDPVNIGAVVRAMKNMGLCRLHLVRPDDFDPYRIEGVAHTGRDVIMSARFFDELPDAIGHAHLVVGTTARGRSVRRNYRRPREQAEEIIATARQGEEVALVFGREDRGLSNDELDLCNRIIVVPTDPEHSSLNLAQAVLLISYEISLVAEIAEPFKEPQRAAVRATRDELEQLFHEVEKSLQAIDFFKSQQPVPIMRALREIAGRADLDDREAALLKAVAYEVRNFLARTRPQGFE
jgi:TrmH family RNA methyltransferase